MPWCFALGLIIGMVGMAIAARLLYAVGEKKLREEIHQQVWHLIRAKQSGICEVREKYKPTQTIWHEYTSQIEILDQVLILVEFGDLARKHLKDD